MKVRKQSFLAFFWLVDHTNCGIRNYYSCLMPYFSFAMEVSFLGKCMLHKSDTIKGAFPNFLLVFAKALWIPLTAKRNIITLKFLEPSSQQIVSLNHVLCLVFVLETDHHSTKKHCRECRKRFCWSYLSCSRQRLTSLKMDKFPLFLSLLFQVIGQVFD